jgi:hypothetical protein
VAAAVDVTIVVEASALEDDISDDALLESLSSLDVLLGEVEADRKRLVLV